MAKTKTSRVKFSGKPAGKKKSSGKKSGSGGNKSNAWRAYTTDNSPIPF